MRKIWLLCPLKYIWAMQAADRNIKVTFCDKKTRKPRKKYLIVQSSKVYSLKHKQLIMIIIQIYDYNTNNVYPCIPLVSRHSTLKMRIIVFFIFLFLFFVFQHS